MGNIGPECKLRSTSWIVKIFCTPKANLAPTEAKPEYVEEILICPDIQVQLKKRYVVR